MTIYNSNSSTRPVTRVCSNDASHTTKQWRKNPNDKTRSLCRKCYETAITEKHKVEGRACSNDASHKTKSWHKDPNDKARELCRKCYKNALAKKHKAEGRVCSNNATHMTSEWCKNPNDKTLNVCKRCYETALAEKQKAEGRVCSNNATHTTKQWRKNPNDKTRYLCKSCYDHALAEKHKADRKRKPEELSPMSLKNVALQSVSEPPLKRKRVEEGAPPMLPTSELFLVENLQPPPTAEMIEHASLYGDVEPLFLPSSNDSSIFSTTNAVETEFMGEIPDLVATDGQSFQASAPPVRENRQSSADMGSDEYGLFGFPDGWNDSSSIATTHAQLPETADSYSYFLSDNLASIDQNFFNYLPENNYDSL